MVTSPYSEFDDPHSYDDSGPYRAASVVLLSEDEIASDHNSSFQSIAARRPKSIVRSLTDAMNRINSFAEGKGRTSPGGTTSAELRTATVKGEMLVSEELSDVVRAQRNKTAIHYHANEAVKAGNTVAVIKGDWGYWIERDGRAPPSSPPRGGSHLPGLNDVMADGRRKVLNPLIQNISSHNGLLDSGNLIGRSLSMRSIGSSSSGNNNNNNNGTDGKGPAKMRLPWNATKSNPTSSAQKKMPGARTSAGTEPKSDDESDDLQEKIRRMTAEILRESHARSGALLDSAAEAPDGKARARVKLIVEHPERARSYVRMGLEHDPDMDVDKMIRMIDYYCSE
ncbi:hypothetical protein ACHAWF_013919 [Thalassiosira exigua]